MQLYTVVLQNKHMISRFNGKGQKIEDKTTFVEQTIRDLPHATAKHYLDTDASGLATMTAQSPDVRVSDKSRHRVKFGDVNDRGRANRPEPTTLPVKSKPAAHPAMTAAQKAARTGDMSAAINAGE